MHGAGLLMNLKRRIMSFLTFIFILVFKVHIFKNIYLSVFGCDGSSLLCLQIFSSCGEQDYPLVTAHGLLIAVASFIVEHGLP